ncbi:MAG: hypothetical protein NC489_08030 [Ruminococcus flavefaciens]|nr:hypothetical protein [Ruminococcus flavefaciens]
MDSTILDLGHSQYLSAIGMDEVERDSDGFVILRPTADRVDQKLESLTTNIDTLEEKLQALRKSKATTEAYRETEAYKADKKKNKNKKKKKERETLLNMVFNNADQVAAAEAADEDDDNVRDSKKKGGGRKKVADTTLDTTYGKRFSTVVSMLYDSIQDFDKIAAEIREELDSAQGRTKGMYRSSQMGNLISATSKKFDAVRELGSIAKTVSDLEYKEKKDKKAEEGTDTTRAISSLAAKYLKGSYESDSGKKGGKKKDKEKAKGNFSKTAKSMGYDPDEDEDAEIKKNPQKKEHDQALAKEFAKALESRSDEFSFTAYEKHLDIEGTYSFVVTCDPLDPEHTWDFMAIDKKGREIEGFRKDYKDLMPRKKNARMRFDIAKKKAVDLNSSKTYKLLFIK